MISRSRIGFVSLVLVAMLALGGGLGTEIAGHWQSGLRADASGYAALVYLASALQLQIIVATIIVGFLTIVRVLARKLSAARRVTFDVLMLLSYYAVGQGLVGLLLVHGFPRIVP
jgi:cytochrome c oxidase subunit I+III